MAFRQPFQDHLLLLDQSQLNMLFMQQVLPSPKPPMQLQQALMQPQSQQRTQSQQLPHAMQLTQLPLMQQGTPLLQLPGMPARTQLPQLPQIFEAQQHTQPGQRHQGMQLTQAQQRTQAQQLTRMPNVQQQMYQPMPQLSAQMGALPHAPQHVPSLLVAELPWFSHLQGGCQEVLLEGQHANKQGGLQQDRLGGLREGALKGVHGDMGSLHGDLLDGLMTSDYKVRDRYTVAASFHLLPCNC